MRGLGLGQVTVWDTLTPVVQTGTQHFGDAQNGVTSSVSSGLKTQEPYSWVAPRASGLRLLDGRRRLLAIGLAHGVRPAWFPVRQWADLLETHTSWVVVDSGDVSGFRTCTPLEARHHRLWAGRWVGTLHDFVYESHPLGDTVDLPLIRHGDPRERVMSALLPLFVLRGDVHEALTVQRRLNSR